MPPLLALLLTSVFIGFLIRWQMRRDAEPFGALWLPLMWMFFTASRFPGQWLAMFGIYGGSGGSGFTEGSPLDAAFFLFLTLAGFGVLQRRHLGFAGFAQQNPWLVLFFVYGFVAISWSDFPFIALKRWVKIVGHPVMALVILTEPRPVKALCRVLKSLSYLYVPLSILFIKYFPEYGRGFDTWSGAPFNRGVALNKNELGYGCMIFILFWFWNSMRARHLTVSKEKRLEVGLSFGFLCMVGWLCFMASSATSTGCAIVGVASLLFLSFPFVNRRRVGLIVIVVVLVVFTANAVFDLRPKIIELLGKDPTLTDRTEVWADVLSYPINPVLGAGFESFWLGERLDVLWAKWWWQPNVAHNGYIETYLSLGYLGIVCLFGWVIATFLNARRELLRNRDFGRFRLAVLIAILIYNYTEATFRGVHFIWTVFHIISIEYFRLIPPGQVRPGCEPTPGQSQDVARGCGLRP